MRTDEYTVQLNGRQLLLRNAREEEADMLLRSFKAICGETKFLVREPGEVTVTPEDERNFIKNQNESDSSLLLLGFLDGEYIGNCSFKGNSSSQFRHRATVGIALHKKYTGLGVGRIMLERLIAIAKEQGFEQLDL